MLCNIVKVVMNASIKGQKTIKEEGLAISKSLKWPTDGSPDCRGRKVKKNQTNVRFSYHIQLCQKLVNIPPILSSQTSSEALSDMISLLFHSLEKYKSTYFNSCIP